MATPTSLPATFVAGNVLTAAQMNDLRGAFRILQVVRATDSIDRTTTSTSFVDANISVTITPTSATSDIMLVWVFFHYISTATGSNARSRYQITDTSNVAISGAEEFRFGLQGTAIRNQSHLVGIGYDSPATTSATTYKGRFAAVDASMTTNINNSTNTGQLFALEVSA
jgi:hypothetical protein